MVKIMREGLYFADGDIFLHFNDGSQYINHSFNANTQVVYDPSKDYRKFKSVTLREIKKGE